MSNRSRPSKVTPEMLLRAYAIGIFPMAEARDDPNLYWIDPDIRGVLPLDDFHIPRSLRKTLKRGTFRVTCDQAFTQTLEFCAAATPGRQQTWINQTIFDLCRQLFVMGYAHSIEVWHGDALVGGLYGVAMGSAFFGESMFSRATDASKVALVHLMARLRAGNFSLLDTQFVTPHLAQFGAKEIAREAYRELLNEAMKTPATFYGELPEGAFWAFVQSSTQRS